jgi:hypothetical protein
VHLRGRNGGIVLGMIWLLLVLQTGQNNPTTLDWDRYYNFAEFTYSEVNDVTAHSGGTILCGGRWNDYNHQVDAEMVLMKHDSDGTLLWEKYYQLDHGTVAYGSCLNSHGNLLITGATRLGSIEEALFLIEVNPSNGGILSEYIVDPAADTPFDMGYDLIQHSNGDYYVLSSLYNRICLVRFDSHLFTSINWWIGDISGWSWAYADCLGEIPPGYNESGMITIGYSSTTGAKLTILESDLLSEVVTRTLCFSCADNIPYNPGHG